MKKKMNKLIKSLTVILLACFFMPLALNAQKIDVKIFNDAVLKEIALLPSFGSYKLLLDDKQEVEVFRKSIIKNTSKSNKLSLNIDDKPIGNYKNIKFLSQGLRDFFLIKTNHKISPNRRYDDNLFISLDKKGNLYLINNVEIDNYIAGVVQAEAGGATDNIEFFKLQALCVRNYLVKNIKKHKADKYLMCDQVHCQAYKGRANKPEVIAGAHNSKSEVIVDKNGNIIETLFHANSGGQTVNSEHVWQTPFSHLVGVQDSFSVGGKGYRWEKYIRLRDWKNYFKHKGADIRKDSVKHELEHFSQDEGRKQEMLGVRLTEIRKDFKLRSTFFTCQPWGSEVRLNGRGYGHGVGLSQEGAINMCEQGYEYWQVIEHYYQGARVEKMENINTLIINKK